ncbi:MAG TPA: phage tail tape measure protein, partial [Candidatus Scalindua sp.]|nr:phage tail tape measure protein [Candidatus Scalindua sp.]
MAGSVDIKIAAHGISTVNRRLKSVGAAFGAMKTKIIATAGPLGIALGAGGVVAALVKSVSESVKFEDALLDLQKVMDSTDGSAKQFTGVVDKLAERYGVASSSVLQGVANFKQAGFTIKESFNLQRAALDLVIAGDLEATEAS